MHLGWTVCDKWSAKPPYLRTNSSLPGSPWEGACSGLYLLGSTKGLYSLLEIAPDAGVLASCLFNSIAFLLFYLRGAVFWMGGFVFSVISPTTAVLLSLQDVGTEYQVHRNTGERRGGIYQVKCGLIEDREHLFSYVFTSGGDIIKLTHFLWNLRILCFFLCFLVTKIWHMNCPFQKCWVYILCPLLLIVLVFRILFYWPSPN